MVGIEGSVDVAVVGGGIVGLATAYELAQRHPGKRLLVIEKEGEVGTHQTGHNSGVIHSGIYYAPDSFKARTCRDGKALMERFCETEEIAWDRCGKVIVATEPREMDRLRALADRGQRNGVSCELVGPERLREIEPHVAGIGAIHVLEAGRADYSAVAVRMARKLSESGHSVLTGTTVRGIRVASEEARIETDRGDFSARYLVNCAGLHSDRIAAMTGGDPAARIVPFRGEYYVLSKSAENLVRALVYPVPDPRFPFLGVHFTKVLSGKVKCGPNAVLAFAREGYKKSDLNLRDLSESLTYPGFQRMARKHWRYGLTEMHRSLSKAAFLESLQRMVPEVRLEHLEAGPTGVRAQAVGRDGALVDDFCFQDEPRVVHVLNAPSPAATASFAIGKLIADRLQGRF